MWTLKQLKSLLRKSDGTTDFSQSAVVVWPVFYPEDMFPPDDPHVTVLYMPDVSNTNKQDVIDAIKKTDWNTMPLARVSGQEMFGPLQDTPVLTLDHDFLEEYWNQLKGEFELAGIEYSQRFPEYRPHVTITSDAVAFDNFPTQFLLAPVELWWQDQKVPIG
jgi:2'-5' RNA ligase